MAGIIMARGLSRKFGNKLAIVDLDLDIHQGEVFGFLGHNGAGKTTTLRLLNGVLKPTSGRATIGGYDIAVDGPRVRAMTGVLTETPSLYEALTGRENLAFFGHLYNIDANILDARVTETLHEFGLADRADERVATYSKGMRQRLAIARALLHHPAILFLDEPTSGLDPSAARLVGSTIAQLSHKQGRTVFLCTHNLDEAQRLCDRVGVIDRGTLAAVGTPQELARRYWRGVSVSVDLRGSIPAHLDTLLGEHEHVQSHGFDGTSLHLDLSAEEDIPEIVSLLVAQGARIYSVEPESHSLADVYFRIQSDAANEGNR